MDPSFLLGARGVQLPSPFDMAQQGMTLGNLANARQLQQRQLAALQRKDASDQAFQQALPLLLQGGDIADLAGRFPSAGEELVKTDMLRKKNAADIGEKEAQTKKHGIEAKVKVMESVGRVAHMEARNPNPMSVKKIQDMASYYGLDLPPPPEDPTQVGPYLSTLGDAAYAVADRVKNEEQARHQGVTEHQTGARDAAQAQHRSAQLAEQGTHNRNMEANSNRGSFSIVGNDPTTGAPNVINSRSGGIYSVDMSGGQPRMTPQTNVPIASTDFNKQTEGARDLMGTRERTKGLIDRVKQYPNAFSGIPALAAYVGPNIAKQKVNEKFLTPDERRVRAEVMREAALEVNRLYGAALSMGESQRAMQFIPDPTDPTSEAVLVKLQAALDWAESNLSRVPPGVRRAAGVNATQPTPSIDLGNGFSATPRGR